MPLPPYHRGKQPLVLLDRRLGEPQSASGRYGEVKFLTLPGLTPWPLGHPAHTDCATMALGWWWHRSWKQISIPGHGMCNIFTCFFKEESLWRCCVHYVSSSAYVCTHPCVHMHMCMYNGTVLFLSPKYVFWTLHNSQKMKVLFFNNIKIVKTGSKNSECRISENFLGELKFSRWVTVKIATVFTRFQESSFTSRIDGFKVLNSWKTVCKKKYFTLAEAL
jgi:hypothetical protein